jgi:hypothetical protein
MSLVFNKPVSELKYFVSKRNDTALNLKIWGRKRIQMKGSKEAVCAHKGSIFSLHPILHKFWTIKHRYDFKSEVMWILHSLWHIAIAKIKKIFVIICTIWHIFFTSQVSNVVSVKNVAFLIRNWKPKFK